MTAPNPFRDNKARFLAGRQGMLLFLASLAMLFGATLIAFIVIRVLLTKNNVWPTDLPPLPRMLWVSTAILILSGFTMQSALNSIRHNVQTTFQSAMLFTTVLGIAFLAVQSYCWYLWLGPVSARWDVSSEYRFALTSFYVLTGLHALHVIGGLIPMFTVILRAFRNRYTSDNHAGVEYVTLYWHFLGAVWIILFAMLLIGA